MTQYTITLTEVEDLALGYVALSQTDWIDNAVHERCRLAIEDIVQLAVQKCLATNTQIPGTKDDIVKLAFAEGWIKSGADAAAEAAATDPLSE